VGKDTDKEDGLAETFQKAPKGKNKKIELRKWRRNSKSYFWTSIIRIVFIIY